MIVNVLGTDYSIIRCEQHEDVNLTENDGYCDTSVKQIVVDSMAAAKAAPDAKKDLDIHIKKVTRHELVHAFLAESGLNECSWAANEEAVDWIAHQFPKMLVAFEKAEAL